MNAKQKIWANFCVASRNRYQTALLKTTKQ